MTAELLKAALAHHRAGRLAEAAALYRKLLDSEPTHAEALYRLGVLLLARGDAEQAARILQRAVAVRPGNADIQNSLGVAYRALGRLDEAEGCYRNALALDPEAPQPRFNLANTLMMQGRHEAAIGEYQAVLEQAPNHTGARNNLALALKSMGRLAAAAEQYRLLVESRPDDAVAHSNLGVIRMEQGHVAEAIGHYRRALDLEPDSSEATNNLGVALLQQGRPKEAAACFRRALQDDGQAPDVHENLGTALRKMGEAEAAAESYDRAFDLRPTGGLAIKRATLLPVVTRSLAEMEERRSDLEAAIEKLLADPPRLADPNAEVGATCFHLSYQDANNRTIHGKVAELYIRACPDLLYTAPHCRSTMPLKGGRLRVGFISKHFRTHAVGWCFEGLIRTIPRERIAVTVFSFPQRPDPLWDRLADTADEAVVLPSDLKGARDAIAAAALDILVYTDIGMDPLTYFLAFSRLAPVQCVMWGHPDTTGIPTLDYFISNDLAEPRDAEHHYSERLVRLGGLKTCYARPALPAALKPRAAFGLPEDAHLYFCAQTLFKVHPAMDAMFRGILEADPDGLLLLPSGFNEHLAGHLAERFAQSLAGVADRVRFLPTLSQSDFMNVMALSQVSLDSWPFGGANTSWQAIQAGTPVVTWPSRFLRGRFTLALYRHMGITDTVAADAAAYVATAVRFATDETERASLVERIAARSGAVFEDAGAAHRLEAFLLDISGRA